MDIVRQLLVEITILSSIDSSIHLNERYLHHLFSRLIQEDYPTSLTNTIGLHPEWATCIKNKRDGGLYRKVGNKYEIAIEKGSTGFIDFAIGHVENPEYAIEFKMSANFNWEGLIYDYMKLLDSRNSFEKAISIAVYYGHSSHSKMCETQNLTNCINIAKTRLNKYYCDRVHRFIFIELIKGGIVRHFECSGDLAFVEIK